MQQPSLNIKPFTPMPLVAGGMHLAQVLSLVVPLCEALYPIYLKPGECYTERSLNEAVNGYNIYSRFGIILN